MVGVGNGEDPAAGGGGQAIQRIACRGQLDELGSLSRRDFQRGLRVEPAPAFISVGQLPDIEANDVAAGRERRRGRGERARLPGDGLQGNDRDRFALGLRWLTLGSHRLEDAATTSRSGPTPAMPSAKRAVRRGLSPSGSLDRSGPKRTQSLPTASLPAAAQRTTWPQKRW